MLRKSQPTLDVSNLYYTAVSRHSSEDPTHSNFKLTYLLALEQFDGVIFFPSVPDSSWWLILYNVKYMSSFVSEHHITLGK